MVKKITVALLSVLLALSLFVGCGETLYTVSVTGGSGGGEFKLDEECTVTATVPENKVFYRWVDGDGNSVSTDNPYTFTVKENVSLTAQFKDVEYTVTVTGGTADAEKYTVGSQATVTATVPDNYKFVKWMNDSGDTVSTDNPYTFTVEGDVALTAAFEYEKVIDGKAVISVTKGTLANGMSYGEIPLGEQVTVKPTLGVGEYFVCWEDSSGNVLSYDSEYTFTAEKNVTLIAVSRTKKNYVLEAESVDMKDQTAPGPSNTYTGAEMILSAEAAKINGDVSNGYFLANVHKSDLVFDFVFTSDVAVSDATMTLRLASELGKTVSLNPDVFGITVNGEEIEYKAFDLYAGSSWGYSGVSFRDYAVEGLVFDLLKGENTISFHIKANDFTEDANGTLAGGGAGGPGMDCIKINTYSELEWVNDYWSDNAFDIGADTEGYKGIYTE